MKPRLLDLFSGAGGAAMGYHRAGFDVVGIDKEPQPNYAGDLFIQRDAISFLESLLNPPRPAPYAWRARDFQVIHASPPCQGYSDLRHRTGKDYPRLIEPVRWYLQRLGRPYVIENVEGAPLIDPVMLCGTMFPELSVLRHRLFEANFPILQPEHPKHPLVFTHDKRKAHYGRLDQNRSFVQVTGGGNATVANKRRAMGIDWMTGKELNEAIPPAYTQHVGVALMDALMERAA